MAFYGAWKPYVPVETRRRQAAAEAARLQKKGRTVSPVVVEGRAIAATFWGKAWCENLERYSDYANRLPRGRTYVRNGSVIDLQIAPGEVKALVSGSDLYEVRVKVARVAKARWESICKDCAGEIDSLIELLQGRFSKGVMERVCREKTGLFPAPGDIALSCSCPDGAYMCKHVAAVLYGVGARLDSQPDVLFRLHDVDEKELIAGAGKAVPLARKAPAAGKVLAEEDLSALFGLEIDSGAGDENVAARRERKRAVKKPRATVKTRVAGKRSKQTAASRKPGRPKKK